MCVYYSLPSQLLVDTLLSCFQFLIILDEAAIYICIRIWTYVFVFLGLVLRSVIAGSYGEYKFKLLRNCHSVFQSSCPVF